MGLSVMVYTVTGAIFSIGGILNAVARPVAELSASEGAIFRTACPTEVVPRGAARIRLRPCENNVSLGGPIKNLTSR